MIKIFGATDKIYTSNGDIVLQSIKAKVHKALNGDFYIDLEAPLTYVDYLVSNNIIVANTPQGEQAFRITNVDKTANINVLETFAQKINADFLSSYNILPKSETNNTLVLNSVMQPDGVHPNDKGHALIAEAVAQRLNLSILSKDSEELLYEKLNLHY